MTAPRCDVQTSGSEVHVCPPPPPPPPKPWHPCPQAIQRGMGHGRWTQRTQLHRNVGSTKTCKSVRGTKAHLPHPLRDFSTRPVRRGGRRASTGQPTKNNKDECFAGFARLVTRRASQAGRAPRKPPPPPCVTFRLVVAPLRGPGRSPVLPFACCVGSLRSVGRCGRCSCWCRFRVRGAQ